MSGMKNQNRRRRRKEIDYDNLWEMIEHLDENQFFKKEGYKSTEITPLKMFLGYVLFFVSFCLGGAIEFWLRGFFR